MYCLLLWVRRPCRITLSRLGVCRLDHGWYLYTGSARRNLLPRLERHLRRSKRLHWNIDHLRAVASVLQIWLCPWTPGGECRTNALIRGMPGARVPLKGFGSSDCRCVAHLVSFASEPAPPDHGGLSAYRVRAGRVMAGGDLLSAASIKKHPAKA